MRSPFLRPVVALLVSLPAASAQLPTLRQEVQFGDQPVPLGQLGFGRFVPGGGAILADLDNHRVIRFAPDGRARPVLGREGAGPGELLAIGNLVAMPNGEIVVADVRKAALVRWDAEGKVLPEVRVRPFMLAVHRVGAQLLIKSHDWRTDTLHLYRVDLQGGAPLLSAASFLAATNPGSVTRVTTPLAAWTTTTAGRILVGHPDSLYLVSELDLRGTLLRQWSRPGYAVARWTEEELDRLEGFAAMATREGGSRARPSRAEFTHRSTIGQESVGMDGRGRLWVLPYITGGAGRNVDVFHPDGRLLGTLDLAGHPSGIWVEGDRMLVWGTTADEEPVAWIYRILG